MFCPPSMLVRVALAALACLALGPLPALAADALFLTWNDCALGGAASATASLACTDDLGESPLYLAFTLGQPLDQVVGMEAVVDLQTQTSPLPDWWHFEPAGPGTPAGCRLGALGASRDFSGDNACADPWSGTTGSALVQDYTPGDPRAGLNQARVRVTAFASSGPGLSLSATSQYYAIRLVVSHQGTLACAGCASPACLVLNSIWMRRPTVPGGDYLLTAPAPLNGNWARWQGESNADCVAVPVRRVTWGQVKSLYR